ncbi:hypothetical protein HNS38_11285 [Lentimicrobium sp. L6]|uniref:hypothetical protein n=1 Tax=Lentimicrobium sp. L6 TaxID=2735916 RepID=UPI001555985F|nr:hypothetical protein [Lentimicrobium sp. L6]NPD85348.1 hypothetical protein [Lentimicrobium sp. L6]
MMLVDKNVFSSLGFNFEVNINPNLKEGCTEKIDIPEYGIVYKPNKPYYKLSLDLWVDKFDSYNKIGLLRGHLVRFIQLNPTKRDFNTLYIVLDSAINRINNNSLLNFNFNKIHTQLIDQALDDTKNLEGIIPSKEYYMSIDWKEKHDYYTGKFGFENRNLVNKAKGILVKYENSKKINEVIDAMIEAKIFISSETIKDQIFKTGLRQIKDVYKERKEELKKYNMDEFGVKTLKTYWKKYSEMAA